MNRKLAKRLVWMVLAMVIGTFLLLGFYCGDTNCAFGAKKHSPYKDGDDLRQYLAGQLLPHQFERKLLDQEFNLDLESEDVIVFLHIQKTGGTSFGKHLVKNLDLEKPCECLKGKKKCDCLTKKKTLWLFSRYSTGWACGLHADWTELQNCVENAMDKEEHGHRDRRLSYPWLTKSLFAKLPHNVEKYYNKQRESILCQMLFSIITYCTTCRSHSVGNQAIMWLKIFMTNILSMHHKYFLLLQGNTVTFPCICCCNIHVYHLEM